MTLLATLRWAPRRLEAVIVAAGLLSFATAIFLIETGRDSAAFYLAVSRFWELLIGAWLALGRLRQPAADTARLCRALGLLLIAAAVFLYSGDTPFPGLTALLPTLGAALVILAGTASDNDPAYRLLALPGSVYVGKMSYSLYLWHWPLLVFAGIYADVLPDWYRIPVAAFAFVPAALSYRFVERPFRKRIWLPAKAQLLATVASVTAIFLAVSTWIDHGHGLPFRLPAQAQLALQHDPMLIDPLFASCLGLEQRETATYCGLGDTQRRRIDFAVWGDSHAAAERPVFDRLASNLGLRGVLFSHPGCVAGRSYFYPHKDAGCEKYSRDADAFIAAHDIPVLFLAARWCLYADPSSCLSPVPGAIDGQFVDQSAKRADFAAMLTGTVERLAIAGHTVWLVHPVPEYPADVLTIVAQALLRGVPTRGLECCASNTSPPTRSSWASLGKLDDAVRVREITLVNVLCPRTTCLPTDADGRPYYRDGHHLGIRGAELRRHFSHRLSTRCAKAGCAQSMATCSSAQRF